MRYFRLVGSLLLASCGSPFGLGDDATAMVTDARSYELVATANGLETVIGYTYFNRTGRTVSIPNCLGDVTPHLEKLVAGEWLVAWGAPSFDCLSAPVTIEPRAQYRDEVSLFAAEPGSDLHPQFVVMPISGTYRLVWERVVWDYQPSLPWGEALPLAQRVSNPFELIEP